MARVLVGRHELGQVPSTFQLHHLDPTRNAGLRNATKSNEDLTLTKHLQHQATQSQWIEKNCLGTPNCCNLQKKNMSDVHFRPLRDVQRRPLHWWGKRDKYAAPVTKSKRRRSPTAVPANTKRCPASTNAALPPKKCAGRSMSPTTHEFQTLRLPRIPDSWRSYSTACRRSFSTAFLRSFSTPLPVVISCSLFNLNNWFYSLYR